MTPSCRQKTVLRCFGLQEDEAEVAGSVSFDSAVHAHNASLPEPFRRTMRCQRTNQTNRRGPKLRTYRAAFSRRAARASVITA